MLFISYDITDKESFEECIFYYKDKIKELCKKNIKVALCGNKTDYEDKREVPYEKGLELALENDYIFMETSCKKMENVKNIFEVLIESTYNELEKNDDNKITEKK